MKNYFTLCGSQKTVEYFGLILTIPDEVGFLTTDSDGTIIMWNLEPTYGNHDYWDHFCMGSTLCEDIVSLVICTVNLNDVDWKTTLKEIK